MKRYVAGRLAMLPLTLLVVSFISFCFLHLAPGNAVTAKLNPGQTFTEEQIEIMEDEFGLNDPFIVQYGRWLGDAVRGDLGRSYSTDRPVTTELMGPLGVSAELAVVAVTMSVAIGIFFGMIATRFRHSWIDRSLMVGSTVVMSVPSFVIGTLTVLVMSHYLPSYGIVNYTPITESLGGNLKSLVFPALSIALVSGAIFSRYVRGSTEEILRSSDYPRTAEAKGASRWRVLNRHVLRNALVPLTTVAGLQFGYLIGGTVITESIFTVPGVGQKVVASIQSLDYPTVQGGVILLASTFLIVNLIVDLIYPLLDPRARVTSIEGR